MNTKYLFSLLCIVIVVACGGSSSDDSSGTAVAPSPVTPPDMPTITLETVPDYQLPPLTEELQTVAERLAGLSIDDFFEQAYAILLERNHEEIIGDGNLVNMDLATLNLNDISDEFDLRLVSIKTEILGKLNDYDMSAMTPEQQLSVKVLSSYLSFEIEAGDFQAFSYPATYGFFGWPGSTENFFTEIIPVTTKAEAELYLRLANQVERRLNQIISLLDARETLGIIEPKITLDFSRQAVNQIANGSATSNSYYQNFSNKVSQITELSNDEKTELLAQMEAISTQRIISGYQALSTKMQALSAKAPTQIGFSQFEGGEAFYQFRLRYFTSSDMTSAQIHQLGLDELARIQQEMSELFQQLGYPQDEPLSESFSRVDSDSGTIKGSEAVAFYEDIIDKAYVELPQYFNRLPEQDVVVIGGERGGFYIGGSDDGTRPGAFYAYTAGDIAYTTVPTLAYHEAVPGHHMQIAIANELNLPTFRRKVNFTSFVEGWGLYAERLAKDAGWYNNDIYGDLGRLQFEAMRASRLVLDTGIHAMGWTYNQSEQFSLENIGNRGSIARYSVWPGQATAYTTGMLKILTLRQRAQDALGENYSIKDFHSAVIENGSMPLNILEEVVEQYIAENQ